MDWRILIILIIFIIFIIIAICFVRGIFKCKMCIWRRKLERQKTPYINQPLKDKNCDQIGVSVYVEKIQQSIRTGAEIIAIASDFGTGKSSLISLLEKEYGILKRIRYKFSTINLWGFVKQEDDVSEIHKNFIYQLVSHLNAKRGSHLSKRMSKNFGVIRLGLGSALMTFLAFGAMVLILLAELIRNYCKEVTAYVNNFIPKMTEEHMLNLSVLFYLLFVGILFYIVTRADIVFSSSKSEGNREIDENIVMDYYKMQVINKGILKHYVVVIEDLDRITNPKVIFDFLIELHKYYIPEYDNRFWKWAKNKVTFIVCIKPAAQLQKELVEWEYKNRKLTKDNDIRIDEANDIRMDEASILKMKEMYSKIFDLIIELKRINIDNYDAILKGLLEEKKEYLLDNGLISIGDDVSSIDGIQWIIRGEELSIREIKQRLNDALILYEVLVGKFGSTNIQFSKCIIVAYLTNAFSSDMLKLKDNAFDNCINSYIKDEKSYKMILEGCSEEFVNIVGVLIEGRQIEADYKVYFYNYPKKSYLYNMFELKVINTLLYDLQPEESFSLALDMTDEETILYAINKINDLKVYLPKAALRYQKILNVVLKSYPQMIVEYVRDMLSYTEDEMARTISEIKDILRILLDNKHISENVVRDMIKAWNDDIPKKSLLEIRTMLCKEHKNDILLFELLFKQDNPVITLKEIGLLSENVDVFLILMNYASNGFDDSFFESVDEVISSTSMQEAMVQEFYIKSYELVTKKLVIEKVFLAMEKEDILPMAIDMLLFNAAMDEVCPEEKYIDLVTEKKYSNNSIKNIHEMEWSNGLTAELCNALYSQAYYSDYIVNAAVEHIEIIDLSDAKIMHIIQEYADEVLERNSVSFANIRKAVLKNKKEQQYEFLFLDPYEGLNREELDIIDNVDTELALMLKNMPSTDMENIIDHFNAKYHDAKKSAKIIDYIYDMCSNVQEFATLFYTLDMDNIRFRKISRANRERIIEYSKKAGMLNTLIQKFRFMRYTKTLIPELEKELLPELTSKYENEKEYVAIINLVKVITQQTMKNIKAFKYMHVYVDEVNQKLLKEGLNRKYLYSITMQNKSFSMPANDRLMMEAENIFIDGKWENMIGVMCHNEEFINMMVIKELYKKEPTTIKYFDMVDQSKDILANLFAECDDDEIISYLCRIKGFKDYDAAQEFVRLIEQRPKVLVSTEVYDYTHPMLIDQYLKRRYTKARNLLIKK